MKFRRSDGLSTEAANRLLDGPMARKAGEDQVQAQVHQATSFHNITSRRHYTEHVEVMDAGNCEITFQVIAAPSLEAADSSGQKLAWEEASKPESFPSSSSSSTVTCKLPCSSLSCSCISSIRA